MAKLYFYYSAMNAGKSTTLLQSNYNYKEKGMETILFAPKIDDRYGEGTIASRIGLSASAVIIDEQFDMYTYVKDKLKTTKKLACILVDEANFLTKDQVITLVKIVDDLKLPVLAYGIRTDFKGEAFAGSLHLLAIADELIEIKTICHCGKKAIMNMRINESGAKVYEGAQVQIGGNDSYVSTCREHFNKGISGVGIKN